MCVCSSLCGKRHHYELQVSLNSSSLTQSLNRWIKCFPYHHHGNLKSQLMISSFSLLGSDGVRFNVPADKSQSGVIPAILQEGWSQVGFICETLWDRGSLSALLGLGRFLPAQLRFDFSRKFKDDMLMMKEAATETDLSDVCSLTESLDSRGPVKETSRLFIPPRPDRVSNCGVLSIDVYF